MVVTRVTGHDGDRPAGVPATGRTPTHVLAWFPGDLLCDDDSVSCWELFEWNSWESGSRGDWLVSDLTRDSSPVDLRALVASELGRPVLEFRADTWWAALPTETGEPGPWHTYPAYKIVAGEPRDGRAHGG
jgi:hypothetical protein